MGKSVLIVLTSHDKLTEDVPTGMWLSEFAEPYEVFLEAGLRVTVASIRGGEAPIDPRSLNEETAAKWEKAIAAAKQTAPIDEMDAGDYDGIFMPGGHGTMFDLPDNRTLQTLIARFAESGKVVGAVCHGPAALVNVRLSDGTPLVRGRKLTAFTNEEERATGLDRYMPFLLEDKLREAGAEFVALPKWSDHIETDGKLVTGQNPQSGISIARELVKLL
jgi:putative intracellular protease/amidase